MGAGEEESLTPREQRKQRRALTVAASASNTTITTTTTNAGSSKSFVTPAVPQSFKNDVSTNISLTSAQDPHNVVVVRSNQGSAASQEIPYHDDTQTDSPRISSSRQSSVTPIKSSAKSPSMLRTSYGRGTTKSTVGQGLNERLKELFEEMKRVAEEEGGDGGLNSADVNALDCTTFEMMVWLREQKGRLR